MRPLLAALTLLGFALGSAGTRRLTIVLLVLIEIGPHRDMDSCPYRLRAFAEPVGGGSTFRKLQ